MCNKCESTVTGARTVEAWEHFKGIYVHPENLVDKMRSWIASQSLTGNPHGHTARKYWNGDHKINQQAGHELAQFKAFANKTASREATTIVDIMPVATYLHRIDCMHSGLAERLEPAYKRAQRMFSNGWESLDMLALHPYNATNEPTEPAVFDECNAFRAAVGKFSWLHMVHISTDDINQIAYYPTLKHMRDGREVRTRLGRYLTKYQQALGISDATVKSMAEKHASNMQSRGGWRVEFKEHNDTQGWLDVYDSDDVGSCMRGMSAVRVYAHEKSQLRLAYVQAGDKIVARCIVRDDPNNNMTGWLRVYPDPNGSAQGRFLLDNLKANGYPERTNLDGVLLRYIEERNSVVCPYIDSGEGGDQSVGLVMRDDKSYLEAGRGDMSACETNGYVNDNMRSCDCCGDSYDEDELTYIENDGNNVCEYCRDENYTYAYGRRYEDYFPAGECVEVGDSYYWLETISDHDIYMCDDDGEYYHIDDLITTCDGLYHTDYVVEINHADCDGNSYAHKDKVHELSDGTTCHNDDADRLEAELEEAEATNVAVA